MTKAEKLAFKLRMSELVSPAVHPWYCTHPSMCQSLAAYCAVPSGYIGGWGACETHVKDLEWVADKVGNDPS